jgi:hypothetical protein
MDAHPIVYSKGMKESLDNIKRFSNSQKMNKIIQNINFKRKIHKFMKRLAGVLHTIQKAIEIDDDTHLHTIFVFVRQSCEDYIYNSLMNDKELNKIKTDVCVELLKHFTNNDEVLCRQVLFIISPKIKKRTFWRVQKHNVVRLGAYFFFNVATDQLSLILFKYASKFLITLIIMGALA